MKVKNIMHEKPQFIDSNQTIQDAAVLMKIAGIGFLPVLSDKKFIGTIADRDIVIKAIAEGKDVNTKIKDLVSNDIFYCYNEDPLETVAKKFEENPLRNLVVLNQDKKIVGVLSLCDIDARSKNYNPASKTTTKVLEDFENIDDYNHSLSDEEIEETMQSFTEQQL